MEGGIICRLLSEYDNLYADISGPSGYTALARDPAFAKRFLTEYRNKILYGTDNFFMGLRPFLDSLKLSMECYRRIYGENAMGLAGKCAPSHAARGVVTKDIR
jgi:predicted TIM-barrel fold metal-dependent hydrolase